MFKNLKIILNKINDLGPEEIKLYFSLNSYQLELLAKLSKSKKSLNAQELKVITNRFGLVDGVFRTQREVGEFLGITPQRVSQIELKATKKIQVAKSLENLFEKK